MTTNNAVNAADTKPNTFDEAMDEMIADIQAQLDAEAKKPKPPPAEKPEDIGWELILADCYWRAAYHGGENFSRLAPDLGVHERYCDAAEEIHIVRIDPPTTTTADFLLGRARAGSKEIDGASCCDLRCDGEGDEHQHCRRYFWLIAQYKKPWLVAHGLGPIPIPNGRFHMGSDGTAIAEVQP
jgi:hypothetical protein